MMKISVVIPTHNGSKNLGSTINSLLVLDYPKNKYEVVVIDNKSDDETKSVVESLSAKHKNIKYFFEPHLGLHYARNRGAKVSKGDAVVFVDDDVRVTPGWLAAISNEFSKHSDTGVVGGKTLPMWQSKPSVWIFGYGSKKTHPLFAYLDYGNKRRVLRKKRIFGNNMAIRKDVLLKTPGSLPDTFPRRLMHLSGSGEAGLIDFIRGMGYKVVYLPRAVVYHLCPSDRMTGEYFVERYRRWGVEIVYSYFRKMDKGKAVFHICAEASGKMLRMFIDILVSLFTKRKLKKHYLSVTLAYALQIVIQLVTVLSNRKLYGFIRKKSYY